jgi:uncharacterized protein YpmB
MKKIIVIFLMMLFLVGCYKTSAFFYIQKIKTNNSKEIVEYVVKKMQLNTSKKIEVDYNTLNTYGYWGKNKGSGKSIIVDCKVKNTKCFIEIKNLDKSDVYLVVITEE